MARYTGNTCPVCEKRFTDNDDIVVCPDCGTPYHRACWQKVGACMHKSEHAAGFEWQPDAVKEDAAHDAVCPNCGTHNAPGSTKCSHCGVPLPSAQAQQPGQSETQAGGPVYARGNGGAAAPGPSAPGSTARSAPGPHFDAYAAGTDGGIYRRELGPEDTIDGIKARDWASYIGKSSMYYLMQFFRMSQTKQKVSLSFSALIFGPAYLVYRKMWKQGLLAILAVLALETPALICNIMEFSPALGGVVPDWLAMISLVCSYARTALFVVLGLFSIYWYKKESVNRIQAIYDQHPEGDGRTDALAEEGGINMAAGILSFLIVELGPLIVMAFVAPAAVTALFSPLLAMYGL